MTEWQLACQPAFTPKTAFLGSCAGSDVHAIPAGGSDRTEFAMSLRTPTPDSEHESFKQIVRVVDALG